MAAWIFSMPHAVIQGLLLIILASICTGQAITYCSPDNTGSSFPAVVYNQYQTIGSCKVTCQSSFAFAIVQGTQCWCSNYAPPAAYQVNTQSCNEQCPGYGIQFCGSTPAGLYGYYQLDLSPSGTAAVSSSATSSSGLSSSSVSTTPSTSASFANSLSPPIVASTSVASTSSIVTVLPPQTTVQSSVQPTSSSSVAQASSEITSSSNVPVVISSAVTSSSPAPSSTFATLTSSPSSSQSASSASSSLTLVITNSDAAGSSSTPTPSPSQVYTSVTTVTGQVRTVVITPTATADPFGQGQSYSGSGRGVSPGKVAGIVVGVALGLAAIIGLIVYFWLRRKHAASSRGVSAEAAYPQETPLDSGKTVPSRQVSQMSSSGLLGKTPRIQTAGLGPTNNQKSPDTGSSGFDRRSVGTDQRLNPHALYVHDESRLSTVSLQDNQDYSRQLRIANPDV